MKLRTLGGLISLLATVLACNSNPTGTPMLVATATNTQPPTETVVPSATPNPFPNPILKVTGGEEVVFDWTRDRCEKLNIPDLPSRAFRGANGQGNLDRDLIRVPVEFFPSP